MPTRQDGIIYLLEVPYRLVVWREARQRRAVACASCVSPVVV